MIYKIQDFTSDEIGEMRLYIEKHVPNHILNNLYILSDNVKDKMITFIGVYRILNSCKNYASTEELREKIEYFIGKSQKVYEIAFQLITEYSNLNSHYSKSIVMKQMSEVIGNNYKEMNELIDLHIILSEYIQLIKTSSVIGVEVSEDEFVKSLVRESRKIAEKEGA